MTSTHGATRPVVLIAGDGPVPTGFARVIEGIFTRLTDELDIRQLGISHSGDPHHLPWPIYPAGKMGSDVWGVHRIATLTEQVRPDVIFLLNDTWVVSKWLAELKAIENGPPIIAYLPIDAGPVDRRLITNFDRLDQVFVYTGFAKTLLERAFQQHRDLQPEFSAPPVGVMPHGINPRIFHPIDMPHHEMARAKIFPHNPEFRDAFIVLNANRNQPRKRIDLTIMGFALFARDKPAGVKLFLHMGARDQGWDIPELVKRYGIEDRVLMSTAAAQMPFVSEAHLNLVYNACDVGVNTSEAEGWGLVSHEHAATKAAQIVPNHSSCAEIWGDAAIKLDPVFTGIEAATSTETHLIAPQDLARVLNHCYADSNYLEDMARKAFDRATQPRLQWRSIALQWRDIIYASLAHRGFGA